MRKNRRMQQASAVLRGFGIALIITLAAMALLTVIVWKTDISDSTLVLINQLLKIGAVAGGVCLAVGRGGSDGFLKGALVGTMYIAVGYACYAGFGGPVSASSILGEWIIGAAAGAFTGAVTANLPEGSARRSRKT